MVVGGSTVVEIPCQSGGPGGGHFDCSIEGNCIICFSIDWYYVIEMDGQSFEIYAGTTWECFPYME